MSTPPTTPQTTSPYQQSSDGIHDGSRDLVLIFNELLKEVRNDPGFRPPALGAAATNAIIAYEVISGALNPAKSPAFTGSGPRGD